MDTTSAACKVRLLCLQLFRLVIRAGRRETAISGFDTPLGFAVFADEPGEVISLDEGEATNLDGLNLALFDHGFYNVFRQGQQLRRGFDGNQNLFSASCHVRMSLSSSMFTWHRVAGKNRARIAYDARLDACRYFSTGRIASLSGSSSR
jgi:hypothetical protein